jgi:hypothetical protein
MHLYGSPFLLLVTHPLPWIRSVPLRNGLYFPFARTSGIMSSDSKMGGADNEEGLLLSKPSPSDVLITDNTKDPVDLEKYKEILRKVVGEMCRKMSPQEAFEFRLRSRFDYRYVPYGTDSPPVRVKHGLSYHVRDADWLAPDGEEIRKFVEDDDRYRVDWGNLAKENGRNDVSFMPQDSISKECLKEEAHSCDLANPHRLPSNRRRFFRILASLPQFALHISQIFYGILMIVIPFLNAILWPEKMFSFVMAVFDLSDTPGCYCIIVIYFAMVGFSSCFLFFFGTLMLSVGIFKFWELVEKLKKDPED